MLNVGPLELLVVLAVALIVVGPERLPELARAVGRAVRQLRDVQNEVRDMVSLGVDDEVRQAASEFKKATGDLRKATDVRGAVSRMERELGDEPTSVRSASPSRAAPVTPDEGNGRPEPEPAPGPTSEEPEATVDGSDEPPLAP